jgi:hypothetical protein
LFRCKEIRELTINVKIKEHTTTTTIIIIATKYDELITKTLFFLSIVAINLRKIKCI